MARGSETFAQGQSSGRPVSGLRGADSTSHRAEGAGSRCTPDLGTIDLEAALFETEKGSIVRLTNGFTVAHPYSLYYNLVGTKGSAKLLRSCETFFVSYPDTADPSSPVP